MTQIINEIAPTESERKGDDKPFCDVFTVLHSMAVKKYEKYNQNHKVSLNVSDNLRRRGDPPSEAALQEVKDYMYMPEARFEELMHLYVDDKAVMKQVEGDDGMWARLKKFRQQILAWMEKGCNGKHVL